MPPPSPTPPPSLHEVSDPSTISATRISQETVSSYVDAPSSIDSQYSPGRFASPTETFVSSFADADAMSTSEKRSKDPEAARDDEPPAAVKVPRTQRRGLFGTGRFAILAEIKEPRNYTRRQKWVITAVVAMAGSAAPVGSGIIFRRNMSIFGRYGPAADEIPLQPHCLRYPRSSTPALQSPIWQPLCTCLLWVSFPSGGLPSRKRAVAVQYTSFLSCCS